MINQLIEIIGKEAALFEDFLALLERQQELLVENNVNGLNEVTDSLREKTVTAQLLNSKREETIERVKADNAIEGDLNVTRLLELVDQTQADRLISLRTLITELNEKILTTRNQNAMLLNRSQAYIAKTVEMLSKINQPQGIYTANGTEAKVGSQLAWDGRA